MNLANLNAQNAVCIYNAFTITICNASVTNVNCILHENPMQNEYASRDVHVVHLNSNVNSDGIAGFTCAKCSLKFTHLYSIVCLTLWLVCRLQITELTACISNHCGDDLKTQWQMWQRKWAAGRLSIAVQTWTEHSSIALTERAESKSFVGQLVYFVCSIDEYFF